MHQTNAHLLQPPTHILSLSLSLLPSLSFVPYAIKHTTAMTYSTTTLILIPTITTADRALQMKMRERERVRIE